MKNICVIITAHQRKESLIRLLKQINMHADTSEDNFDVLVFHDGPTDMMNDVILPARNHFAIYSNEGANHGKRMYWKFITKIFASLKQHGRRYDYYYLIPDDCKLTRQFFKQSQLTWESITDPEKICLNTYLGEERNMIKQWGIPLTAKTLPFGSIAAARIGWMDMEVMFTWDFLEALEFRVNEVTTRNWDVNPTLGSGVGEQISWRLFEMHKNIYQVVQSLSIYDYHPSKMNILRPKDGVPVIPLRDRNSKIVVGIATISRRKQWLADTINSLKLHCDEIHVYLDDYLDGSEIVKHFDGRCKVKVYNAIDTKYPLGSSGKFYGFIGLENAYCFVADDDLVYREDYITRMITRIEANDRKYVICSMGSYCPSDITDYWQDRTKYGLFHQQDAYAPVNIPGTGVTAFHTDTLKIDREDFETFKDTLKLSDIWFASVLKSKKVEAVSVPHPRDWVKHNPNYKEEGSLYNESMNHGEKIANVLKKHVLES